MYPRDQLQRFYVYTAEFRRRRPRALGVCLDPASAGFFFRDSIMPIKPHMFRLHPKSKKLCSCCDEVAVKKLEIQTSWFRGDDDVFLLCPEHVSVAEQSRFDDIYYDYAMAKERRRGQQAA
ncbi:hypothetical protein WCQ02_31310 [Paraburkholderia tropica]|uniref:hypothetical protein n=1 Tax=Paraburkholderia tropica TaxID=92647 RepID=UPI0030169D1B